MDHCEQCNATGFIHLPPTATEIRKAALKRKKQAEYNKKWRKSGSPAANAVLAKEKGYLTNLKSKARWYLDTINHPKFDEYMLSKLPDSEFDEFDE